MHFSLFFLSFFLNFALGPLAARYPSYGGWPHVLRGAGLCLPSRFTRPRRTSGTALARPLADGSVALIVLPGHTNDLGTISETSTFQREQTTAQIRKKKEWTNQRKIKQRRRIIKCSKAASSHYLTKCNTAVLTLFRGQFRFRASGLFETRLGPRYSDPPFSIGLVAAKLTCSL